MKLWVCLLACGALCAQPPGVSRQRQGGFPGAGGPGGVPGTRGGQTAAVPNEEKPPTPPEDLCQIEGRVTAAGTGEPVRKAMLMLTPTDRQPGMVPTTASTGDDGGFALRNVEPGRYRFWVSRNGYVRQEYGARSPGRGGATLTLNRGQRLTEVNFSLVKQSVITGRVVDEEGEPVSRAWVQAMKYSWIQGRKTLRPSGSAQTDDRGIYRIHDLPAGKYFVAASWMGMGDWFMQGRAEGETPEESYTPTYYPGTNDPRTAAQVEAGVGTESQGIDVRLLKSPTVRVRGRVVNPYSTRPGRTMVSLLPRGAQSFSPMDRRPAMVDRRGAFELRGVTAGSYMLSVDYFDGGQRYGARMPLDVGRSPIDGITLTVGPGLELAGTVKIEGDASAPAGLDLRVMLENRDMPMYGGGGAELKDDFTFRIPSVMPGVVFLRVWGLPSGYYLKSARYGQEDALVNGIDLTQGAAGSLDLTISPAAARVEGVVLDARQQPVKGVTVVLAPERGPAPARSDLYKSATTDQNGHYALESLPPGKYRLFAFEELEDGAYQDADYLKEFEARAEKLDLAERASIATQVTMIPAEGIALAKQ